MPQGKNCRIGGGEKRPNKTKRILLESRRTPGLTGIVEALVEETKVDLKKGREGYARMFLNSPFFALCCVGHGIDLQAAKEAILKGK